MVSPKRRITQRISKDARHSLKPLLALEVAMSQLQSKLNRIHRNLIYSRVYYGLEELKYLRSVEDFRAFFQKTMYLMPRITGTVDKFTEAPPSLQIEPTNCCNLRCICCSAPYSSRKRGYMDFELFKKIVNDAASSGTRRIYLYLHGEPMLHPKIVDMIHYCKAKGLAVHIATNGMLFTNGIIESILSNGASRADQITFSILGASKNVHEKIMVNVNHERVVKNIAALSQARSTFGVNGPVIEAILYIMPENTHEMDDFYRYWHGKVDHVRLGGDIKEAYAKNEAFEESSFSRTKTCPNIWERMTIYWNGDVTLCIQDLDGEWILGNMEEQSICEVWNSEKLLAIKAIHKNKQFGRFPFCQKCDW